MKVKLSILFLILNLSFVYSQDFNELIKSGHREYYTNCDTLNEKTLSEGIMLFYNPNKKLIDNSKLIFLDGARLLNVNFNTYEDTDSLIRNKIEGRWYFEETYNILTLSINEKWNYHFVPSIIHTNSTDINKQIKIQLTNLNSISKISELKKVDTRRFNYRLLDFILGLLGGVFAAFIYQWIKDIRRNKRYKSMYFDKLNKRKYNLYWKHNKDKDIIWNIELEVNKRKVIFKGEKPSNNVSIEGEFTFDENMPFYAKGYYHHPGTNGFGFIELQTNEKLESLYINAPYIKAGKTREERELVPQAYIGKPEQ